MYTHEYCVYIQDFYVGCIHREQDLWKRHVLHVIYCIHIVCMNPIVCCSVLQCVAVCCSVLQCVAVCCM